MVVLKLLVLTLTFYHLIVTLDAICQKGQKVSRKTGVCESCPHGSYQPEPNDSQKCRICTRCNEGSGSFVKEKCTKETDTKCQCNENFIPSDSDSSTCKCGIGFGKKNGVCSECESGYFSTQMDMPCQKWKECILGAKIKGTTISDVTCEEELKSNTDNTTSTTKTTSNKVVSLITHLKSHPPHMPTTTTRSRPGHTVSPTEKVQPGDPSNTGTHTGMALLVFGIVGLLVLTAVTCKLNITPFRERKPAVQTQESLCRRPVEESGDDSLSSLKLNPGEA